LGQSDHAHGGSCRLHGRLAALSPLATAFAVARSPCDASLRCIPAMLPCDAPCEGGHHGRNGGSPVGLSKFDAPRSSAETSTSKKVTNGVAVVA
jgi:hypothetical protein